MKSCITALYVFHEGHEYILCVQMEVTREKNQYRVYGKCDCM